LLQVAQQPSLLARRTARGPEDTRLARANAARDGLRLPVGDETVVRAGPPAMPQRGHRRWRPRAATARGLQPSGRWCRSCNRGMRPAGRSARREPPAAHLQVWGEPHRWLLDEHVGPGAADWGPLTSIRSSMRGSKVRDGVVKSPALALCALLAEHGPSSARRGSASTAR